VTDRLVILEEYYILSSYLYVKMECNSRQAEVCFKFDAVKCNQCCNINEYEDLSVFYYLKVS
jgi:hypothetical protein